MGKMIESCCGDILYDICTEPMICMRSIRSCMKKLHILKQCSILISYFKSIVEYNTQI